MSSMPDEHPSTPEKELLNFIEEKKAPASLKARSSLRRGKSFLSFAGIRARFAYAAEKFKNISFKRLVVDIQAINTILLIAVIILAVGFVFDFTSSLLGMNNDIEEAFAVEQGASSFQFGEVVTLKNSSSYLEKARKRDIFKIATEEPVMAAAVEKVPEKPKEILTKTKDLKLVGISWSNDPDAMIEDTRSKRTFFVKRGGYVNDVKVEAIFRDKVILSYEGEEVELK